MFFWNSDLPFELIVNLSFIQQFYPQIETEIIQQSNNRKRQNFIYYY